MNVDRLFGAANISASGLSAERTRMEIVATNIANAHASRTPQGGPYRRQDVVFAAVLGDQLRGRPRGADGFGGVQVVEIIADPSELPRVHHPGHPDADDDGMVTMPNVQIPLELVNLMTANRAYEANLKVLQAFRQQADMALSLLRG
jgi:flagellar basal-body rod protein FlgC